MIKIICPICDSEKIIVNHISEMGKYEEYDRTKSEITKFYFCDCEECQTLFRLKEESYYNKVISTNYYYVNVTNSNKVKRIIRERKLNKLQNSYEDKR